MNRLIQQAFLQVLAPIFDPQFPEASYGLCPGRRAQDAVKKARQYVEVRYEGAVDEEYAYLRKDLLERKLKTMTRQAQAYLVNMDNLLRVIDDIEDISGEGTQSWLVEVG